MRARHAKISGGGGGKSIADAADPRRRDACARGRNGTPDPARTSAAPQPADTCALEGTSSNSQTSTAAGKTTAVAGKTTAVSAKTTAVSAKATAVSATTPTVSATAPTVPATTTATGVGCDRDKGNDEEQHRGNANAGLQRRPRIKLGQFRSGHWRRSRQRMHKFESF
jgi:cell division septation protein DedD